MKSRKTKVLTGIFVVTFLLLFCAKPARAATLDSGSCGEDVAWALDSDYTLIINGSGAMDDYTSTTMPWHSYYQNIRKIVIQSGVTEIGDYAFAHCYKVDNVQIADTVTRIGKYSFSYCSGISSMSSLDNVTMIEKRAFANTGMSYIGIAQASIAAEAFYGSSLTMVTIGAGVPSIGDHAFERCSKMVSYSVNAGNDSYSSSGGVLFNKDRTRLIQYPAGKTATSYTIPDTVTYVADQAFYSCDNLESVNVSDSVTSLGGSGYGVFQSCDNLKEVRLSRRLTSIANWTFAYCDSLQTITIPGNVTHIGNNAFRQCTALDAIYFRGNAPSVSTIYPTTGVTATAYYPSDNDTWTEEVRSDFGDGTFTWKPYTPALSPISGWQVVLDETEYTYDGTEKKPDVTVTEVMEPGIAVTMRKGTDYTLSYEDNINAGTASVKVSGRGEYTGVLSETFVIAKKKTSLSLSVSSKSIRTGETATIKVMNSAGGVTFQSKNPSVATVSSVTGALFSTGTVTGIAEGTADILVTKADTANETYEPVTITITVTAEASSLILLESCEVSLSADSYTYDGTAKTPAATITYETDSGTVILRKDTDYTASYSNNINAGTATVQIQGLGNYTGIVEKTFSIERAAPSLQFETANISKTTKDNPFTNPLSIVTDGVITYVSGNTAVAKVNAATGEVDIAGEGTAVIRASAAPGANYTSGSAEYTLVVTAAEPDAAMGIDTLSYHFRNSAADFGYGPGDNIPLGSFQIIFGDTTKAKYYYAAKSEGRTWGGNCAGLAGTSALLYDADSGVGVKDFDASAVYIKDLDVDDRSSSLNMTVKTYIEALQVAQYTQLFRNQVAAHRVYTEEQLNTGKKTLDPLYEEIRTQINRGEPVVLTLYQNGAGHAVLVYGIKEESENVQLCLYDNNYPEQERYLTMRKDSSGNYMEWSYDIGGTYGIWGTDTEYSSISYVEYSTVAEIWNTRGRLQENENLLTVNSDNVEIVDSEGATVAAVTDGKLDTENENIEMVEDLTLDPVEEETLLLSLPVDVYTVVNLDAAVEEFQVSMANINLGAAAATTAGSVTLAVDDSCDCNIVQIDAAATDNYNVTLNSSFGYDYDTVTVEGQGKDETLEISQEKGTINISNCHITSIVRDGEKILTYNIITSAGEGGTITSEGTEGAFTGEMMVVEGEDRAFVITPDSGYRIKDVLVDGVSVGPVSRYTFENVSAGHRIYAIFEKVTDNGIPNNNDSSPGNGRSVGGGPAGDNEDVLPAAAQTVKNMPKGTTLRKPRQTGAGKILLRWKRNRKVSGYQIQVATSKKFRKAKKITIKKNKVVKKTVNRLKKKVYYLRIRTYQVVDGKRYYSDWSGKKKIRIR